MQVCDYLVFISVNQVSVGGARFPAFFVGSFLIFL